MRLGIVRKSESTAFMRGDEACLDGSCYRRTPDGQHVLDIFDDTSEPSLDLRRILDGAEFSADGYPASEVMPR